VASGTESALSPRSAIHTSRRRFSWDRLCFVPPSKCYRCRLAHQLPTPIMLGMNFGMTSHTQGPFIKNSSLHKDNKNPDTTGSSTQKNPTRLFLNSKLEVELSLAAAGGDTWRKLLWLILEAWESIFRPLRHTTITHGQIHARAHTFMRTLTHLQTNSVTSNGSCATQYPAGAQIPPFFTLSPSLPLLSLSLPVCLQP